MRLPGFTAEVTTFGRSVSFQEVAAWASYPLAGAVTMAGPCPTGQTQVCNQVCSGYKNVCECVSKPTRPIGSCTSNADCGPADVCCGEVCMSPAACRIQRGNY
jgi:hypothetical protein